MSAIDLVEGCEMAGIMVIANRKVQTLAASDEKVRVSDRMQGDVAEGPCFDAVRSGEEIFRIADTRTAAPGWPRYAPCAEKLGFRSMLGFKLFTHEETLGALNLYSTQPGAFSQRSEETGWLLASHSAVALAYARNEALLHAETAIQQRIGEAIGILMAAGSPRKKPSPLWPRRHKSRTSRSVRSHSASSRPAAQDLRVDLDEHHRSMTARRWSDWSWRDLGSTEVLRVRFVGLRAPSAAIGWIT